MVEIEFEHKGIEELLTSDNEEFVPVTVTLKNKGEFLAYITPLKYKDIPTNTNMNDFQIGQKVLLEHVFDSQKQPFTLQQLKQLPAGWTIEFINAIKQISGFDENDKTIRDFYKANKV